MAITASIYIPEDRRQAMAAGHSLPDRTVGTALFADISGFTPLTEALARELGPRRGAEELTRQLNIIYGGLIAEVQRYRGSVIGFSGDAITCWFDGDGGLQATACAMSMQRTMEQYATISTPSGATFPLAIKVAVTGGPARRFLVGDPDVQYWDVLAGATLDQLAAAEHEANSGEVVTGAAVANRLSDCLQIREWRKAEETGESFAVVSTLDCDVPSNPWPDLPPLALTEELVRPWVLPTNYERVKGGQDMFEAELRPAVALFLRFGGIDYDGDADAGEKLDAFTRWIQATVGRYDGSLLQLTMGDKGSYAYVAFGAPIAHEDDVARAALAALQLRKTPPELAFIEAVQIGISKGRMRVGPYGSPGRRTYGVLGDHTNLAARLMQHAQSGEVLVSASAQKDAEAEFEWQDYPPLQVKGKTDAVSVYRLVAPSERVESHLQAARYALPMVGRHAEMAQAKQMLDQVLAGQGQVLAITAEAGLGKSRLVAEIARMASQTQLDLYIGDCQSYGTNNSYLVWYNIWRDFFGLDPDAPLQEQLQLLDEELAAVDPALARRLPLLGVALNLPIPDNDLTASMDAKLRKESLEALLADVLRARAQSVPLALVIDDAHWLDQLSDDLLEALGRAVADLPVLTVVAYRPPELEQEHAPKVTNLPQCTVMPLTDFTPEESERLIALKISQLSGSSAQLPATFLRQITERAEGNPFYIEELINYLHDRDIDPADVSTLEELELPTSLQSLILSRIDQLSESQKITVKVASIIGRLFRFSWLWGVEPELGEPPLVRADLEKLSQLDLTPLDQPEPEAIYLFKHIVTREVAYKSLPHATRTLLHGQLARFVERTFAQELDQYVNFLAYHYDLSPYESRRREYLQKAADSARSAYANAAAIDYYRRLLPLLPEEERVPVMLQLGQVLELVGEWGEVANLYDQALELSELLGDRLAKARSQSAKGGLLRKQGEYDEAAVWLERARNSFDELGDLEGVGQTLHFAGALATQQGDLADGRALWQESLTIRRQLGDRAGVATLLNNLGIIAYYEGDYETALGLYEESLAQYREIGDRVGTARSLNNSGLLASEQGDYETARSLLDESVTLFREVGDRWGHANSLNNLGQVIRELGDYATARSLFEESLAINRQLGDKGAIAYLLDDFAVLAAAQDRPVRAMRLGGAAAALRESIGAQVAPVEQAKFEEVMGGVREQLGAAAEPAWAEGEAMTLEEAIAEALSPRD